MERTKCLGLKRYVKHRHGKKNTVRAVRSSKFRGLQTTITVCYFIYRKCDNAQNITWPQSQKKEFNSTLNFVLLQLHHRETDWSRKLSVPKFLNNGNEIIQQCINNRREKTA